MKMVEFDMRIPVCDWLISRGYLPVLECGSLRNCDIVGVRFDERRKLVDMVAVELKLSRIKEVIEQCTKHLPKVSMSIAVMPVQTVSGNDWRFKAAGVGIVGLRDDKTIDEIYLPEPKTNLNFDRWQRAFWRRRNEHEWRRKHPQMLRYPAQHIVREENRMAREKAVSELAHEVYLKADGHEWCRKNKVIPYDYCKVCLSVKLHQGHNSPCRGPRKLRK